MKPIITKTIHEITVYVVWQTHLYHPRPRYIVEVDWYKRVPLLGVRGHIYGATVTPAYVGEVAVYPTGIWLSEEEYRELKEKLRAMGCRKQHSTQKYLKSAPVRRVSTWYRCGDRTLKLVVVVPCGPRAPEKVYLESMEWV